MMQHTSKLFFLVCLSFSIFITANLIAKEDRSEKIKTQHEIHKVKVYNAEKAKFNTTKTKRETKIKGPSDQAILRFAKKVNTLKGIKVDDGTTEGTTARVLALESIVAHMNKEDRFMEKELNVMIQRFRDVGETEIADILAWKKNYYKSVKTADAVKRSNQVKLAMSVKPSTYESVVVGTAKIAGTIASIPFSLMGCSPARRSPSGGDYYGGGTYTDPCAGASDTCDISTCDSNPWTAWKQKFRAGVYFGCFDYFWGYSDYSSAYDFQTVDYQDYWDFNWYTISTTGTCFDNGYDHGYHYGGPTGYECYDLGLEDTFVTPTYDPYCDYENNESCYAYCDYDYNNYYYDDYEYAACYDDCDYACGY